MTVTMRRVVFPNPCLRFENAFSQSLIWLIVGTESTAALEFRNDEVYEIGQGVGHMVLA